MEQSGGQVAVIEAPSCFSGSPWAVLRQAEADMMAWRARPADMRAAVADALAEALCGNPPLPGATAAGEAVAGAVAAHAASMLVEPAYHNQYHQAEAARAMGWLCAAACRQGLLLPAAAVAGVLAMAGHDLHHDGSRPPQGVLEAHSAAVTVALAASSGLDTAMQDVIRRVILATDPLRPAAQRDADDLLCRIAQEADLFGSLTPNLGWQLSQALEHEYHAACFHPDPPVASYAGRLQLLCGVRPTTPAGVALGLAATVADQIAALAACGDGDAAQGAGRLDTLPAQEAEVRFAQALKEVAAA
ncbi:MAG TPA: hypothetical protein VMB34_20355 [Acetobacteraceae bacterium]|nr:hypothetical protein [Acetobacteraceae bacterium]